MGFFSRWAGLLIGITFANSRDGLLFKVNVANFEIETTIK